MSAFIERITGGQVGGTTERSIRLSLSFIRLGPVIILLLLVLAMTLLSPVRAQIPGDKREAARRAARRGGLKAP